MYLRVKLNTTIATACEEPILITVRVRVGRSNELAKPAVKSKLHSHGTELGNRIVISEIEIYLKADSDSTRDERGRPKCPIKLPFGRDRLHVIF